MAILRVQHSFQGSSGDPKDQYVNTFHITAGGFDSGSLGEVAEELKAFYAVSPGTVGSAPISYYLANASDEPGARIKIYDLSDPIPRTPIYDETYTPTPHGLGAGVALPSEVACCLSYAANPVSGVPVARTRGRIYIGPLNTQASEDVIATGVARPRLQMRQDMVNCAARLANAWADIDPVMLWVVYSPTSESFHGIVRFWADDAWDTQRRRGDAPTSRVTATI